MADQSTLPSECSTYVLNATDGQTERLELSAPAACDWVRHGFPRPLADGRVSLSQFCEFAAPASPNSSSASYAFVAPGDLDQYLVARLTRRMQAALVAVAEDRLVEMEHGVLVATTAANPMH